MSVQCIVAKRLNGSQMPFGVVGRACPWMKQTLGFGDRSTEKSNFGGKCGAPHCNQWGLNGVAVRKYVNRRSCDLEWSMGSAVALLC